MKRPPVGFRSNFEAAQPPILIDSGVAILENEKIERHIMKHVPGGHNLFIPEKDIEKKIENLYNKFKMMLLTKDESSKTKVTNILQRIDDGLRTSGTRFLTGEDSCHQLECGVIGWRYWTRQLLKRNRRTEVASLPAVQGSIFCIPEAIRCVLLC